MRWITSPTCCTEGCSTGCCLGVRIQVKYPPVLSTAVSKSFVALTSLGRTTRIELAPQTPAWWLLLLLLKWFTHKSSSVGPVGLSQGQVQRFPWNILGSGQLDCGGVRREPGQWITLPVLTSLRCFPGWASGKRSAPNNCNPPGH